MEQQRCPCKMMLIVQDKWHVDSEVKTGSVAFLVLLWQCLRHLTSLCFCACSGWPDFPAPSAYLKSHGELSAPLFWPRVAAALQVSFVQRFSSAAKCVQFSWVASSLVLWCGRGRTGAPGIQACFPLLPIMGMGSGALDSLLAGSPIQQLHLLATSFSTSCRALCSLCFPPQTLTRICLFLLSSQEGQMRELILK